MAVSMAERWVDLKGEWDLKTALLKADLVLNSAGWKVDSELSWVV